MNKRIFIGIALNDALKEKITLEQKNLKEKFRARFIEPQNLHITLAPPFYIEENEIADVITNTKYLVKKIKSFKINFNMIEIGPTKRNPRLIWISGKTSSNFKRLKVTILKGFNVTDRHQEALPHITIARFKRNYRLTPVQIIGKNINWRLRVDNITIFESVLSSKGAQYHILDSIILAG